MSLLGSQVFANPTTPLWGGGGGGGGSNPTYTSVSFTPVGSPIASSQLRADDLVGEGSTLHVMDADGFVGPLAGTRFYAKGPPGRIIYQADGIDFQDLGSTSYFLATVDTSANRWNLSNIATINGSNYPPGGGGGSNFQLLNITQTGGNAGELNFFKDASGTSFAQLQMYPNPAAVVGSQVLSVYDASGLADTLQVGDLQAAGTGSLPGAEPPALSLGLAGTGTLGLRLVNTDVGGVISTYATFASNAFALSNVTTINGSAYPPAAAPTPVTLFTANDNGFTPTTTGGISVASISYTPTQNGKAYVSAVCSFLSGASEPGGYFRVSIAGETTFNTNIPSVVNGLPTSAFTQGEFDLTAGRPYTFTATATGFSGADFYAQRTTMYVSFLPS